MTETDPMDKDYQLFVLSAESSPALEKIGGELSVFFRDHPGIDIADVAYTLSLERETFPYRKFFVCQDPGEALEILSSPETTASDPPAKADTVIFMFPGQGAQYVDMGRELYEKEHLYQGEMDRCFEILRDITGQDFKLILYPPASNPAAKAEAAKKINQSEYTQPILFAFEYGMAKFLIRLGITPGMMIGHSLGEYTAACLSGVFSLEEALKLVTLRGKLMTLIPPGSMLSVSLAENQLLPLLDKELCLAAVNSPKSCVVSGTDEAVRRAAGELKRKKVTIRPLHTSHAFHSYMMDPILDAFTRELKKVSYQKPRIPFISNLTGKELQFAEISSPAYWCKHLRNTVRFSEGLTTLIAQHKTKNMIFSEVGPGRTLSTFLRQHNIGNKFKTINLVKHPQETQSDRFYFLHRLGEFWLKGLDINWDHYYGGEKRCKISLP